MKCRTLCISFAAAFLLGVCGQVAAQQVDGGQNAATRAPAPHEGKSAAEIAKELSNPAGTLASLYNFLTYTTYKGDLPDSDQDAWGYSMQPVLPFPVGDKGRNIIVRPLIPFTFDMPKFDETTGSFKDSDFNLGDISAQVVLAGNEMKDAHNGLLWGIGANFAMPTATDDDLGGHRWTLGPTLFGGILRKWGLLGAVLQHSMYLGGSNGDPYSVSSGQYFIAISLGNGWQIATSPNFAYDWKAADSGDRLTLPVGIGIAKTMHIGKMPLKIQNEIQYYVAQADTFGPDWMYKLTVTPVIKNPFLSLF